MCVLVTQPFWVSMYVHLKTALAVNLQFQFESSGSSLMTYLQTIVLSRGLGQSPGILTHFVTVNR